MNIEAKSRGDGNWSEPRRSIDGPTLSVRRPTMIYDSQPSAQPERNPAGVGLIEDLCAYGGQVSGC